MKSKDSKEWKCPVEVILAMVSGKWKIMIFRELASGKPVRYNQISDNIPHVSAKVLTQQLREMEADGLLRREIFQEIPPRVEYSLTECGLGILKAMMELRRWGYGLKNVDMSKCEECGQYRLYYDE